MKILLVEDSASMRSYLSNIIENGTDDDVEIVEAANGFEALKTLPHHKFDAILTDINMPDINGLELVSFLKNHPIYKSIHIMVISTESTAEDRKRAASLGAEEYLSKPFEAPELVDKLRRLGGKCLSTSREGSRLRRDFRPDAEGSAWQPCPAAGGT